MTVDPLTVDPREIGDWTVSDADFLGTFRLPDTSTKRDRLAVENEHTRDKRIQFFEEEHYYTIDEHRAPWSVTKLCHLLCTEFDPDRAVVSMKRGSEWHKKRAMYTKEDGELMTDEEIKAKWEHNGKSNRHAGP